LLSSFTTAASARSSAVLLAVRIGALSLIGSCSVVVGPVRRVHHEVAELVRDCEKLPHKRLVAVDGDAAPDRLAVVVSQPSARASRSTSTGTSVRLVLAQELTSLVASIDGAFARCGSRRRGWSRLVVLRLDGILLAHGARAHACELTRNGNRAFSRDPDSNLFEISEYRP